VGTRFVIALFIKKRFLKMPLTNSEKWKVCNRFVKVAEYGHALILNKGIIMESMITEAQFLLMKFILRALSPYGVC